MPASQHQTAAFLALKNNLYEDRNWKEFWKRWDGFILTIIRKKLFFAPEMWEDCKSLVDIKIFRYIEGFDETREISPWLARVVTSCCEDTKEQHKYESPHDAGGCDEEPPENAPRKRTILSLDDENIEGLLNMIKQPESRDDLEHGEMLNCLWRCIGAAMEETDIDPRQKTAFELFYRYEFKLREIAETYNLPVTTVNNWPGATLKRILPRVRDDMEKLGYTIYSHESHEDEAS